MKSVRKTQAASKRPRRGRASRAPGEARSNRIVTFVTDWELKDLAQIAYEKDRSLSSLVHRIIAQHLKNISPREREAKS